MDQILSGLDRIAELSDDELKELRNSIVAEYKTASKLDSTREVVEQITQLADAADAVKAERTRRDQEAAELSAAREAAAARIEGDEASTDDGEVTGEDDEIDPATGKKKKKVAAGDPDVAPLPTASTDTPAESEASASTDSVTEFGVEQPAVQPEEIKDAPEVGKSDDEVLEKAVDDGVLPDPNAVNEAAEDAAREHAKASKLPEIDESQVVEDNSEATAEEDTTDEKGTEETVTAAAGTPELEAPADRRLSVKAADAPVVITAGADIPGVSAGSTLPNLRAVAQAILDRKKGMGRTSGGDGEQHTVATFTTTFPEARTLSSAEFDANSAKVENVVSAEALTAAGGLCAPVDVRYDIFGLGELGRPVRDSLAVFGADRGGIRFVTPPTIEDLEGAVSLWTLQDDIDAATPGAPDPVKPCIRVACGQEVVVYIDAIPLCLTFGNLGARAWPELVERHTQLGMIWHARYAETRLLTRIGALSTAVTTTAELGAARDFFVILETAAAGYRNRHRMSPNDNLRVILPEWFRNALRADITKQLPGDGLDNTFELADATVNRWFAIRNINVTWHLDGETGQVLPAQAAGALNAFPANVIWYLFAEGTFLFLDGGTLDLGLVRDSTLNGTNDYKIFLETFEGVAKVGIESLRVTTPLRIYGASAATVDTVGV